jgi:hypothetical protein
MTLTRYFVAALAAAYVWIAAPVKAATADPDAPFVAASMLAATTLCQIQWPPGLTAYVGNEILKIHRGDADAAATATINNAREILAYVLTAGKEAQFCRVMWQFRYSLDTDT